MSDDLDHPYHYDYDCDGFVDDQGNPAPDPPPMDPDRALASIVRFLIEGDEREEARMLLACDLEAEETYWRNDLGPDYRVLVLTFHGPRRVFDLLGDRKSNLCAAVERAAEAIKPSGFYCASIRGRAAIVGAESTDWRNEVLAVLDGTSVHNQAIGFKATKTYAGLCFRSESEVRIAQALDRANVMFLPNCRARIGSRAETRRGLEADFVVMVDGKWGALEVDGSEWHPPTRAAQDHQRDRPLRYHGAAVVERFDAGECFENPDKVVAQFLALLGR